MMFQLGINWIAIALASSVAFVIILLIFVLEYTAYLSTHPPWYHPATGLQELPLIEKGSILYNAYMGFCIDPKTEHDLDFEDISIPLIHSKDPKLKFLRGWYIPRDEKLTMNHNDQMLSDQQEPLIGVIILHGGGGDRREMLRHVPYLHQSGFEVILYDASHHGLSDGYHAGIAFGYRERFDCTSVVHWAKNHLHWDKVALFGTSVGASTCILAANMEPMIDMVIAENPLHSLEDLLIYSYKRILAQGNELASWKDSSSKTSISIIAQILQFSQDSLLKYTAYYTAYKIRAAHPLLLHYHKLHSSQNETKVIKLSKVPLLIMHSIQDGRIPYKHAIQIHELSRNPTTLWITEQGNHAELYNMYPEEYKTKVLSFIKYNAYSQDEVKQVISSTTE